MQRMIVQSLRMGGNTVQDALDAVQRVRNEGRVLKEFTLVAGGYEIGLLLTFALAHEYDLRTSDDRPIYGILATKQDDWQTRGRAVFEVVTIHPDPDFNGAYYVEEIIVRNAEQLHDISRAGDVLVQPQTLIEYVQECEKEDRDDMLKDYVNGIIRAPQWRAGDIVRVKDIESVRPIKCRANTYGGDMDVFKDLPLFVVENTNRRHYTNGVAVRGIDLSGEIIELRVSSGAFLEEYRDHNLTASELKKLRRVIKMETKGAYAPPSYGTHALVRLGMYVVKAVVTTAVVVAALVMLGIGPAYGLEFSDVPATKPDGYTFMLCTSGVCTDVYTGEYLGQAGVEGYFPAIEIPEDISDDPVAREKYIEEWKKKHLVSE